MGKHFGNLAFLRGIKYYFLSPHEQKPWPHFIASTVNVVHRTRATIYTWLPAFIAGYAIYRYCEWANYMNHRKDPNDYRFEAPPIPPPQICTTVEKEVPYCERADRAVPEMKTEEECRPATPEEIEKMKKKK